MKAMFINRKEKVIKMKISVILTSYNHEKFLRQSIESVLEQTYQDFEFIIVDDCSIDHSWKIICEYKDKYPQIIAIRHDYNWHGGSIDDAVRNYASGDYIAVHHSDDIWMKDKLEKQVELIRRRPEYAAVFTNAEAIDDEGNAYTDENGFYYQLFRAENKNRKEWLRYFFYHGNCLCHPSILIRKDVYAENDFFRKGLCQIPDFVKWIQICRKHEIYVLPQALVKFRIHGSGRNTSGMRAETQIRSSVELFLMLEEYAAIANREEFLEIFPEAESYAKKEAFLPEYAFGKVCTQAGAQPYTRLFGIKLLYQALNDPQKAHIMEKHYGYTKREFMNENGKYDIFGILPAAFEQTRSIYVDCGNGFSSQKVYQEQFMFQDAEEFCWTCRLAENGGGQIKGLRFDPAEGLMVKVKIERVTVNGADAEFQEENALCSRDGWQLFLNLDPIYTIKMPDVTADGESLNICIEGKMERLGTAAAGQAVMEVMYEKRDMIYEYQGEAAAAKKNFNEARQQQERMEQQINMQEQKNAELERCLKEQERKNCELDAQLQKIKSSKWYRLAEKVHLFDR